MQHRRPAQWRKGLANQRSGRWFDRAGRSIETMIPACAGNV